MLKKSVRCVALFLALLLVFAIAYQTTAAPKSRFISPGDFRINNGDSQVNQQQVTLTFSNPKGVKNKTVMRIKNENSNFTNWKPFKNNVPWQLSPGSGQKTVTVELKYLYESRSFSASVYFDDQFRPNQPNWPHKTLTISDVSVKQLSGTSVEVFWRTSEPSFGLVRFNGEIRNYAMNTNDDRANIPNGFSGEHRIQIDNLKPNVTYYAIIEAVDRFNQHSNSPEFTFSVKMTPQFSMIPNATMQINNHAEFTNNPRVNLQISLERPFPGMMMSFSNDGFNWSPDEPFQNNKGYDLPGGDGRKTIHARFRSSFGPYSQPCSDSITLDTRAPQITDIHVDQISGDTVEIRWRTDEPSYGLILYNREIRNFGLRSNDNRSNFQSNFGIDHSIRINRLDPGRTYYAKIETVDRADNHGFSQEFSFSARPQDQTPPTGSIRINNGAEFTNNPQVNLTLSANDNESGIATMSFSNNGFNWSPDEPYQMNKGYQLSGGDGPKTIFVRFRDQAGNYSQAYSDRITLDSRAPQITDIHVDQISGDTVEIRWRTDEPSYGLILYNREIHNFGLRSNDNRFNNYNTEQSIRINRLDAGRIYYAKIEAIDRADNHGFSQEFSFSARPQDHTPPTGSIRINNGAEFTNNPQVNLTLSANDNESGIAAMSFSNNGFNWSPDEPYQTYKSFTLYGGDGIKTIFVRFRDQAGNYSQAFSDRITLDSRAPMINNLSINQISGDTVEIRWRTDEPAFGSVQFNADIRNYALRSHDNRGDFQGNYGTDHAIRIDHLQPGRMYFGKIEVVDRAGNRALSPDFQFNIQGSRPTPPPVTPPPPQTGINVALQSNGSQVDTTFGVDQPYLAIDGNPNTAWHLAMNVGKITKLGRTQHFWQVRLKQTYNLKKIRIKANSQFPFIVQYRQNNSWITLQTVSPVNNSYVEIPSDIQTDAVRLFWDHSKDNLNVAQIDLYLFEVELFN